MTPLSSLVSLRVMTPDDRRFVASSWFESYWKNYAKYTNIPFQVYKRGMDKRINKILDKSLTIVVHAEHIPDEILGYAVYDEGAIHWCYVKSAYRKEGIATALCKDKAKWYTHQTADAGTRLAQALNIEFNPFFGE